MDKGKILVIDDDESILNMCKMILTRQDYQVETSLNRESCLKLIQDKQADVILSDLNIPGDMDAIQFIEKSKTLSPSTDIIIMTGFPTLETAITALKKGAYDYLIKPVDIQLLKVAVNRCFEKQRLANDLNQTKIMNQELQAAYMELQKVEHLKEAFLSKLNHELRTPLTMMKPALELLESEPSSPDCKKFQEILHSGLTRMQEMIDNLLIFSNLSQEQFQMNKTRFSLKSMLERLIQNYKLLWEDKQMTIQLSFQNHSETIFADADLLETAMKHLLLNAIKFDKIGGKVRIEVTRQTNHVCISFSDTGPGIPAERLAKVFDAFYQAAEYLTREVGGLGLGLAIVRRIVEAHAGIVQTESRVNEGSTFKVILPME